MISTAPFNFPNRTTLFIATLKVLSVCPSHASSLLLIAANLLLSDSGVLKIADFGLARPLETENANHRYTATVVTRWYRAPELLLGERQYTTAVDIWSCGCVLGELVAGKAILQGADDEDQKIKIWDLCGSPDDASWEGWRLLEGAKSVEFKKKERRTKEAFNEWMSQRK